MIGWDRTLGQYPDGDGHGGIIRGKVQGGGSLTRARVGMQWEATSDFSPTFIPTQATSDLLAQVWKSVQVYELQAMPLIQEG